MDIGNSRMTDTILRFISDEKKYEMACFIDEALNKNYLEINNQEQLKKIFEENVSEFLNNVTPDELLDLRTYTGYYFKNINAVLRNTWNYEENGRLTEEETTVGNIVEEKLSFNPDNGVVWPVEGSVLLDYSMESTIFFPTLQQYQYNPAMILSGNVDAYLEVIEKIQPVDDLALYGGDFEFGTDSPTYIEVEFSAKPERFFQDSAAKSMLEEFISAVAVRVARDLLALLPITKVLVHVEVSRKTVLSVVFDRNKLRSINFRSTTATDIIKGFPGRIANLSSEMSNVERMEL